MGAEINLVKFYIVKNKNTRNLVVNLFELFVGKKFSCDARLVCGDNQFVTVMFEEFKRGDYFGQEEYFVVVTQVAAFFY